MRSGMIGLALAIWLTPAVGFAQSQTHRSEMIVTFSIKDYDAWRPVFDGAAPARAKAGVGKAQIFRNTDAANDLLVVFDVASKTSGRAWMSSSQVRADWQKGGVIGTPSYRFAQ